MGGGNAAARRSTRRHAGLSPRGRGKPIAAMQAAQNAGSIPAWAGETQAARGCATPRAVYPRVGGGNAFSNLDTATIAGLSPRGRGKPGTLGTTNALDRSIPAWAGETLRLWRSACRAWVYPRVGGGNAAADNHARRRGGLSPRGRGKLHCVDIIAQAERSIPAWAGETRRYRPYAARWRVYPRVGGGNF